MNIFTRMRHGYAGWYTLLDGKTRAVLGAFVVLAVQPLLIGEINVLLSPHKDASVAGIITGFVILAVIFVALLGALIRRRMWAWWTLVVLFGIAVIIAAFKVSHVVIFLLDVTCLALLLSPPMRRYVSHA